MALFSPFFPDILGQTNRQRWWLTQATHQWHHQQAWLFGKSLQPAGLARLCLTEPELLVPLSTPVDEGIETETLDKALKLTLGHRTFVEIHEMSAHATLGKEAQRFSRFRAFLDSKDLDFHLVSGR